MALILVSVSIIPVYSAAHNFFALQYLRSSLTVPLFFERQIKKDTNFTDKLAAIDSKITIRKWSVITAQVVILFSSLAFVASISYDWVSSIDRIGVFSKWDPISLYEWATNYDWQNASKQLLYIAISMNLVSLAVIVIGLIKIKKWIKESFDGHRRWHYSKDGLFLFYFILLVQLSLLLIALLIWISTVNRKEFSQHITSWNSEVL